MLVLIHKGKSQNGTITERYVSKRYVTNGTALQNGTSLKDIYIYIIK
jgi:hypothetical protein